MIELPPEVPAAQAPRVITAYLDEITRLVACLPVDAIAALVELLDSACLAGRKVLLCGNGGSSATASHWANDLSKGVLGPQRPRLRALALTDSMPLLTAVANDMDYARIFAEQLLIWAERGDVVVGISGSGNSPNVLQAIACARDLGVRTVGLSGFGGGVLAGLVDLAVVVDSHCMEQVEDAHLMISHAVTIALRERAQPPLGAPGHGPGAAGAPSKGALLDFSFWTHSLRPGQMLDRDQPEAPKTKP
jgi:D-sedoheptulose 7-phosphate isomerase